MFGIGTGAVERRDDASAAVGIVKKFHRRRTSIRKSAETRVIYFPSRSSCKTRGRSEDSGRRARKIVTRFCLSDRCNEADEADQRRRSADCRFKKFQSDNYDDGDGHGPSRRNARTALASERGRVAILYRRERANDGGRDWKSRTHGGFSGGRRRLCAKDALALRREYGRHGFDFSRNVQGRSLRRIFVLRMARAHAAGISDSPSLNRQRDLQYAPQTRAGEFVSYLDS